MLALVALAAVAGPAGGRAAAAPSARRSTFAGVYRFHREYFRFVDRTTGEPVAPRPFALLDKVPYDVEWVVTVNGRGGVSGDGSGTLAYEFEGVRREVPVRATIRGRIRSGGRRIVLTDRGVGDGPSRAYHTLSRISLDPDGNLLVVTSHLGPNRDETTSEVWTRE